MSYFKIFMQVKLISDSNIRVGKSMVYASTARRHWTSGQRWHGNPAFLKHFPTFPFCKPREYARSFVSFNPRNCVFLVVNLFNYAKQEFIYDVEITL